MSSYLDAQRALSGPSTTSKEKAFEFDSRPDKMWMNPISMSSLQRAVKNKSKTVVLNGRLYNITYGIKWHSKVFGDDREVVKLKRADGGYVPFGYVSMDRIMKFQFEGED